MSGGKVDYYNKRVRGHAFVTYRAAPPGVEFDDVLQNAAIGMWKAEQSYDPEHSNGATLDTYSVPKRRHEMYYGIRRQCNWISLRHGMPLTSIDQPGGPELTAEEEPDHTDLVRAVDALDPGTRDLVLRLFVLGETPSEVAEHYGVTASEVAIMRQSAVRKLRRDLLRKGYTPGGDGV